MPSAPKKTAEQIIDDLKNNRIEILQLHKFTYYEPEEYQAILEALKTNKSVNTLTPSSHLVNDDSFEQYLDLLASKKEITTLNLNDHGSNISSRWDLIALGLKDNQTITTLNTKSTYVTLDALLGIFETNFTITQMSYNSPDSVKPGKEVDDKYIEAMGDLILSEQDIILKRILEQNKEYQKAFKAEKEESEKAKPLRDEALINQLKKNMTDITFARSDRILEALEIKMTKEGEAVRIRGDSIYEQWEREDEKYASSQNTSSDEKYGSSEKQSPITLSPSPNPFLPVSLKLTPDTNQSRSS